MKKRGQATLFIILAVVIVAIIVIFFLVRPKLDETQNIVSVGGEIVIVEDEILDCVEIFGLQGIELLSFQGGRIDPNPFLEFENLSVSYGLYQGENVLASIEEMESELSLYLEDVIKRCINLKELDYEVIREGKVESSILDDKVEVIYNFPINVKKGDIETRLDGVYVVSYNINLGLMYSAAKDIVDDLQKGDLDVLDTLDTGFNISIAGNESVNMYIIENPELLFVFANDFGGEE